MLTAAEISAMQDTVEEALPDTASVLRATQSTDAMGGMKETWQTLASNVPCRLSPDQSRTSKEQSGGSALVGISDWVVTFPQGQDVTPADRLRIDGRTFEVTQVRDRSWELSRRVKCTEVA